MEEINKKIEELKVLLKEYDQENNSMITIQADPFNHTIEVSERPNLEGSFTEDEDGVHFESEDGNFGFGVFTAKDEDSH